MAKDPPDAQDATQLAGAPAAGGTNVPYLMVLTGLGAGSIFRLEGVMTIGRDLDAGIRLLDRDISRKHARVSVAQRDVVAIEDLGSTNGVSVNGRRITGSVQLADGDTVSIASTTALKFTYHDGIEEEFERKLQDRAQRDSLTGVYKREYFEERLRTELAYARRHGSDLTLLILDVDRLQEVNERWDRLTGDAVLARFARRLEPHLRAEDVFARHEGGTFALLCRGISRIQAHNLAERLRARIRNEPFPIVGDAILVTTSIGIGAYPADQVIEPADLLALAYYGLHEAKEGGGDRICMAPRDLGVGR